MTTNGMEMIIGGRYNWRLQLDNRLVYMGKQGAWHQFSKSDEPRLVWCELLTEDLRLLEETTSGCQQAQTQLQQKAIKDEQN